MKNNLTLFVFLLFFGTAMAQESYWKAGTSLNLPVLMRGNFYDNGYRPFPGFNVSFEKMLGKHTSFVLNLESNRRNIHTDFDQGSPYSVSEKLTITQFSLVPEFRMYLGKREEQEKKGQGFFLQIGLPVLSYSLYSRQMEFKSVVFSNSKATDFDYLFNGKFDYTVPFGFGVKYPFKSGNGIELNFNTDLESLLNQEYWQTFQMGIKYFWLRKK